MNDDSRESQVENSELGQDEGGRTTGTSIIVGLCLALISALHNLPTSASAMMPELMQELAEDPQNTSERTGTERTLTTDELENGSNDVRMSGCTRDGQRLAGGKKSASAPGHTCTGSNCAWA